MSSAPNPLNDRLKKALIAGTLLSAIAIALFLILWVLLGSAGVEQTVRLLMSLCLPPAIIAAILGVYILLARPGGAE